MTNPTELSCREQLEAAFGALNEAGYFTAFNFACCGICTALEVPEENKERYVACHVQAVARGFDIDQSDLPIGTQLDDGDDLERPMKEYHLINPMHLQWAGDPAVIIVALLAAGLRVGWQGDTNFAIEISAGH